MKVVWYKCKGNVWCYLDKVIADHPSIAGLKGIYIIWTGEKELKVLRVGYGTISEEINSNRNNLAIRAFFHLGVLISWAEVPEENIEGILEYLMKKLKPKFYNNPNNTKQISINFPWNH